jgi:hypothetical protein
LAPGKGGPVVVAPQLPQVEEKRKTPAHPYQNYLKFGMLLRSSTRIRVSLCSPGTKRCYMS